MERSVSPASNPFFFKKNRVNPRSEIQDAEVQNIRLSFDTKRILSANAPKSIDSILLQASNTEELSFQPTVPVKLKSEGAEINDGLTVANRIGRMDYRKSQALVMFSISGMGLLIGLLISFVI